MRLQISIGGLSRTLIAIAALLTLASLVTQVIAHTYDLEPERLSFSFFNVDAERNVPTTFQAGLFLGCSFLLACISAAKVILGDRWRRYWAVMALAFALLAWDEITEVHEHLIHLLRPLGFSGVFYFAWIVPAALTVLVLAVAYSRFLLALPAPYRGRLVTAGVIFMMAVFPLEALGGWYFERLGEQANVRYVLLTTVEEGLEMLALILFLHTLATYLAATLDGRSLVLSGSSDSLWLGAPKRPVPPAAPHTTKESQDGIQKANARPGDRSVRLSGEPE